MRDLDKSGLDKKRGLLVFIPVGLSLLTIATYFRSLSYGFMFDDVPTIEQNILLRIQSFRSMFLHNQRWLSTWFNKWTFLTWGADPYAFRVQSLLLHILLGLLVFYLFYFLFSRNNKESFLRGYALSLAGISSGLFLLHPVQSLTAAYIAQMRQEGLVLLCILLSCIALAHGATSTSPVKRYFFYSLVILLTGLGCGTKEIIIVLPGLLMITDWFLIAQGNRSHFISRLPLHGASIATIIGLYLYMKQSALLKSVATTSYTVSNNRGNILTPRAGQAIHPLAYAMSQLQVIVHYLTIFFIPVGLCFDYSYKILESFFDYRVLTPLGILLALLFFIGKRLVANQTDTVSFCFLWFFIGILPRASIVPSMEFTCDYRTYITSPGMMLLIAIALVKLLEYLQEKAASYALQKYGTLALFTLIAPSMCLKTRDQTMIWRSLLDMWGDVVEKNPTKPRGWNNYAVGLAHRNRIDEAIEAFNKAIECDPTYAEPVINLAYQYQQRGEGAKAMEFYKKAINMKEVHPEMYNNVGYLHMNEKRYYNAEESFKVALHLKPHYTVARVGLSQTYAAQEKFDDAENLLKKGIELDPTNRELVYVYGNLLSQQKKYAQACEVLLKSDTTYKDTHFLIGSCFYNQRNYAQAAHHFLAAYNANPHSWNHAYNLAMSYLNSGQTIKAMPLFEQCMPHKDKPPFTLLHLLRCYKETGKIEKAQQIIAQMVASNLPPSIIDEAKKILV